MLSAYVKAQGKTLPTANEAAAYADDASISSWAKDAVAQMQTSGIMIGKENNQFDPGRCSYPCGTGGCYAAYRSFVISYIPFFTFWIP